jgi:hypothetical protein
MSTKTEYRTVQSGDLSRLDEEVNKLLAEGYSLYGNPYVIQERGLMGSQFVVCQALLRETKASVGVG